MGWVSSGGRHFRVFKKRKRNYNNNSNNNHNNARPVVQPHPPCERHRGYTRTTRERSFKVSLVAMTRAARACGRGLNARVSIEPVHPPITNTATSLIPPTPHPRSPLSLSCTDVARSDFSTTELSTVGAWKDFVSLLLLLLLPASVSLLTFHCASRNSTSFMAGFYAPRHENTLRRRAVNEKEIGLVFPSFLCGRAFMGRRGFSGRWP